VSKQQLIQDLLKTEQTWTQAFVEGDLETLERLMHPEYFQVQPNGSLLSKAAFLASFDSGERHWEFALSDEHKVQLFTDAAVLTGRWRAKGVNHGEAFDYAARFVSVYAYLKGTWLIVSDQSTDIS